MRVMLRFNLALSAALLSMGCKASAPGYVRVGFDLRVRSPDAPTGEDADGVPIERDTLWMRAGRLYVESTFATREEVEASAADSQVAASWSRAILLVDFRERQVWLSRDGLVHRRQSIRELVHEEQIRARRALLETIDRWMLGGPPSSLEELDAFRGGARVVGSGGSVPFGGREAAVTKIAGAPGVLWKVAAVPELPPLSGPELREEYLAGLFGVATSELLALRDLVTGVPLRWEVLAADGGEGRPLAVKVLYDIDAVEQLPFAMGPSVDEVAGATRLDRSLASPSALLDALEHPERLTERSSRWLSRLELLLRCSVPELARSSDRLIRLAEEATEPLEQVELARLVLRLSPQEARSFLRRWVRGDSGARGMNGVEALVAEESPWAVSGIFSLLERRRELSDVDAYAVVTWALQHLRVASRRPFSELAELRAPEPLLDPEEIAAARSRELEAWLGWWRGARAAFPDL